MANSDRNEQSKGTARACEFCRVRKTRCDNRRPACGSCTSQRRHCVYNVPVPRERPTTAALNALRMENKRLVTIIQHLKAASPETAASMLEYISFDNDGNLEETSIARPLSSSPSAEHGLTVSFPPRRREYESTPPTPDEDLDVSPFLSIDDQGDLSTFGPSSALQSTSRLQEKPTQRDLEYLRNKLIAKAALSRQLEYELFKYPDIDGVPIQLALHLLDLHWNRQHHTFLLTYRPVIMRDLVHDGPYASKFLLNSIFACASKFSQRVEIRDDPQDPKTAGGRFFRRCDELLAIDSLLMCPSIPTIIGLLLLGSTFNAKGITSKGWLYTGYALRMVYDMGLHVDRKITSDNAEEVEIRRRVFWGAYICDKLQSLYLGRPMAIQHWDFHVSHQFMDTIEEKELYSPYVDPTLGSAIQINPTTLLAPTPIYSVSCFKQLCRLSKIMTKIINKFYVVGATAASARASLESIDESLTKWSAQLPLELRFDPRMTAYGSTCPAPNVLNLLCIFHSLVILLHRPLVADGHLRSAEGPASSWKKCTAAARSITDITLAYQTAYTLRGAPYLISYSLYVACTIHVRNVAALEDGQGGEHTRLLTLSLQHLEELTVPNTGVSRPLAIIKKLMLSKGVSISTQAESMAASTLPMQRASQELADPDFEAILRTFSYGNVVTHFKFNQSVNPSYDGTDQFQGDLLYGFMSAQDLIDTEYMIDV